MLVLKQEDLMSELKAAYPPKSIPPTGSAQPLYTLFLRTLAIVLTNLISMNGVVRLGWNAVPLVLMFILEGLVVLVTDFIKLLFSQDRKGTKFVFNFECLFIIFYGFFASIVFGPYDSLQSSIEDGFHFQWVLISGTLLNPLSGLFIMRLIRLGYDLMDSGVFGGRVQRKLELDGGRLMLLLFFATMLAPLLTISGPNPLGGLVALVILKTCGELFEVWSVRIPRLRHKARKSGTSYINPVKRKKHHFEINAISMR